MTLEEWGTQPMAAAAALKIRAVPPQSNGCNTSASGAEMSARLHRG